MSGTSKEGTPEVKNSPQGEVNNEHRDEETGSADKKNVENVMPTPEEEVTVIYFCIDL